MHPYGWAGTMFCRDAAGVEENFSSFTFDDFWVFVILEMCLLYLLGAHFFLVTIHSNASMTRSGPWVIDMTRSGKLTAVRRSGPVAAFSFPGGPASKLKIYGRKRNVWSFVIVCRRMRTMEKDSFELLISYSQAESII